MRNNIVMNVSDKTNSSSSDTLSLGSKDAWRGTFCATRINCHHLFVNGDLMFELVTF